MSSSRSIAAARNRRAGGGEQQPQTSRTRPNTSIASQAAFSHQPLPPQQQTRKIGQNNVPPPQLQQTNKISISDAIGLITIRLGRVEQYMQNLQEHDGGVNLSGSENLQLIDKDVIHSLTERIYNIENKPQQNINVTQINQHISVLEKEIKELKELLDIHTKKMGVFISETEQKFTDVDAAFVDLEQSLQTSIVEPENIQLQV